jgi:hypothetical protein
MAPDLEALRAKVQAYLTSEGPVLVDSDGDYGIRSGSSQTYVRVLAHPNGEASLVTVFTPLLRGVTPTPELYEYVATHQSGQIFGRLFVSSQEGADTVDLYLDHALLGDFLDREELLYAAYGISGTADDLDDELKEKFGGERFWEDAPADPVA